MKHNKKHQIPLSSSSRCCSYFVYLQYKVSVSKNRNFVCLSFSIGGLILDKTISDPNLEGIIVFAPVINGELEHVWSAFLKIVKMHLEGLYMP